MRRTVATLLVVATALLMAVPVGASDGPPTGPASVPAAPVVVEAPALPAAPPAVQAPVPPAAPEAVQAPAAPSATRPAVKAIRAKVPAGAGVTDAAYAARLQADLCLARQIFCGLDHSGRYPAR
ncbi:MAG TPA: hypothetical protein VJS45_01175 [Acidimicrobiia bacterium]|nr:hypothetical protein [Acidimicrobiia bacterium]